MKKLFFVLVVILIPVSLWSYDIQKDGIFYNLNRDAKTAEVTMYSWSNLNGEAYSGEIIIPASIISEGQTYSVTSIGYRAFNSCTGLISVEIPNSVTSIDNHAFYMCTGLASVRIEDGDQTLSISTGGGDYDSFAGCELTNLYVGRNIRSSSGYDSPFSGTNIKNVTIGNKITTIGYYLFYGCTKLTSIEIPNSVTAIGGSAFSGCTGLTSIEIPNSVTEIGYYTFSGCTGLTSIEIPNSVTSIGGSAFSGCTGLTSIEIPNSVTSIGGSAFSGCI